MTITMPIIAKLGCTNNGTTEKRIYMNEMYSFMNKVGTQILQINTGFVRTVSAENSGEQLTKSASDSKHRSFFANNTNRKYNLHVTRA